MFRQAQWIALAALLSLAALLLFFIVDQKYEEIPSQPQSSSNQPPLCAQENQRLKGVKDLYLPSSSIGHIHLSSDLSSIELHPMGKNIELIEQMEGVRGQIQKEKFYLLPDGRQLVEKEEGVYSLRSQQDTIITLEKEPSWIPMQEVCYFIADHASYHYRTGQFVAKQAQISLYSTKGHELPVAQEEMDLLMKGDARMLELELSDKGCRMHAEGLHATIYNLKELQ